MKKRVTYIYTPFFILKQMIFSMIMFVKYHNPIFEF